MPIGDDDRKDAEDDRNDRRRQGAEDEHEHDQGDRNADRFAGLEVLLGLLLNIVADTRGAGNEDAELVGSGVFGDVQDLVDVVVGVEVIACHLERDDRDVAVVGNE